MECIICFHEFHTLTMCKTCNNGVCCRECLLKLRGMRCPLCRCSQFKQNVFKPGDFSFIKDELTSWGLTKTYEAICNVNMWQQLKQIDYAPMRLRSTTLSPIFKETENLNIGHSGTSWTYCMSHMQYISNEGWNEYLEKFS